MEKKINIRLSNRHIHLSEEDERLLFGEAGISVKRYTAWEGGGPFAANETVTLRGPKGEIRGVRVMGPSRSVTQAEILTADQYALGIEAPVRMSAGLQGGAELTIEGPCGTIVRPCAIVAHRHIHLGPDLAEAWGLPDGGSCCVRTGGVRALIFENVLIKYGKKPGEANMHIDTEEGNAAGIRNNSPGEIVSVTLERGAP